MQRWKTQATLHDMRGLPVLHTSSASTSFEGMTLLPELNLLSAELARSQGSMFVYRPQSDLPRWFLFHRACIAPFISCRFLGSTAFSLTAGGYTEHLVHQKVTPE